MSNESKRAEVSGRKKRGGKISVHNRPTEQDDKDSYKSSANMLTIISVFLSALALVSSLRSCQIAQDAQELTRKQYQEDRLLVLEGEFNEEGDQVKLKPTDNSLTFLEGR